MRLLSLLLGAGGVLASLANNLPAQEPLHPLSAPPPSSSSSSSSPSASETEELLALHKLLVDTESVSGNEHAVGVVLTEYLRAHGFTVEHQTLPPLEENGGDGPRNNILAYRGSQRRTRVLLTSHIDTVPPFYPYSRDRRHGRDTIRGRGAVDAKGSVAAQVLALQSLLSSKRIRVGDCALLFVVGEEVGGDGMRAANRLGLAWEAVIFGEPTELKLASGHKGAMGLTVTAHGKAGHSGYPWLGENAISMLLPALAALERQERLLPHSAKYGNTTLNLGTVRGGVAPNVIAERAAAGVQIRLAGGTPEQVRGQLRRALARVDGRLELDFLAGYGPVDCDTDVAGFETATVNYGTDVPHLRGRHRRYLYGPGSILVAHSDHEALEAADLVQAAEGYGRLVLGALARQGGEQKGERGDRGEGGDR